MAPRRASMTLLMSAMAAHRLAMAPRCASMTLLMSAMAAHRFAIESQRPATTAHGVAMALSIPAIAAHIVSQCADFQADARIPIHRGSWCTGACVERIVLPCSGVLSAESAVHFTMTPAPASAMRRPMPLSAESALSLSPGPASHRAQPWVRAASCLLSLFRERTREAAPARQIPERRSCIPARLAVPWGRASGEPAQLAALRVRAS